MTDLSEITISALIASPIMMATAAVVPQYAWALGLILILLGILSATRAYLDCHDLKGYILGGITFLFGVATEFASFEALTYMTLLAIVIDAFIGLAEKYA